MVEEVCLSVSLKTGYENLNLVKSYDKTNTNDFVFSLWGFGWLVVLG